jgi:hypothetical protein
LGNEVVVALMATPKRMFSRVDLHFLETDLRGSHAISKSAG